MSCECRQGPNGCIHAWRPTNWGPLQRPLRERLQAIAEELLAYEDAQLCLIARPLADELRVASAPILVQVEPGGGPLIELHVKKLLCSR